MLRRLPRACFHAGRARSPRNKRGEMSGCEPASRRPLAYLRLDAFDRGGLAGASHQPVASRIARLNLRLRLAGNPGWKPSCGRLGRAAGRAVAVEAYERGL